MGEGDNFGRTVDVGDHAAGLCTGETTAVGSQAQLDLISVDRVVTSKWMATFVAPMVSSQSSSGALVVRSTSGLNTLPSRLLEPDIADLDGHDSCRAIVLRQDRLEHLRANRVAAPSDIEGKLRSRRTNALGTGALPLRPHQTQVCGRGDRIYMVQASLLSR